VWDEIHAHLGKAHPEVGWELGPTEDGNTMYFAVSPDLPGFSTVISGGRHEKGTGLDHRCCGFFSTIAQDLTLFYFRKATKNEQAIFFQSIQN
jgi:hypothetical protein